LSEKAYASQSWPPIVNDTIKQTSKRMWYRTAASWVKKENEQ